ncbi:MAG: N-formylglutamate amidohydrolase, partial [Bdellovibrionales bacterium]|nr:N-formylglutamate amidohydrolase [Bdellovibrionales bacterium]
SQKIFLTCEHATNWLPTFLKREVPKALLNTHRAYDLGAKEITQYMTKSLGAESFYGNISRLAIDLNRTRGHKNSFSIFSKKLPTEYRNALEEDYLGKYTKNIFVRVEKLLKQKKQLVVFSVHTFTPVFKGNVRKTEIGLLFRPTIKKEVELAKKLKRYLQKNSNYAVHFNLPYRGHTDCFLNHLSDRHKKNPNYLGIFFEVNQRLLKSRNEDKRIAKLLSEAIKYSLED